MNKKSKQLMLTFSMYQVLDFKSYLIHSPFSGLFIECPRAPSTGDLSNLAWKSIGGFQLECVIDFIYICKMPWYSFF